MNIRLQGSGVIRCLILVSIPFIAGCTPEKAEALLVSGAADLAAFGRPALSTPDLVERLQKDVPLNPPDMDTFYTPGEKGYTDYPVLAAV